ncbi:hypothetical protein Psta_1343 [Pirellula staleyi DSM 6068]|uniref:Uncharacterized protein n=1 Tax=Pirellula staleyi (strain ATCC 27377 / DSM 6068 / ICPB 4128) TaxID=530564 RepID=D2QWR6_PIRSD|nr:hypothetical protein Psta_1343 [Pirellula staleyi DSM 6068]
MDLPNYAEALIVALSSLPRHESKIASSRSPYLPQFPPLGASPTSLASRQFSLVALPRNRNGIQVT